MPTRGTVFVSKLLLSQELGTRPFPLLDFFALLFVSFFHFFSFFHFISLSFVISHFFLRCESSIHFSLVTPNCSSPESAPPHPELLKTELLKSIDNKPNCEKARRVPA
jgi:hypothetical protein